MSDNIDFIADATKVIATDEIGGVHYQIIKLAFGVLDSLSYVSSSTPLPSSDATAQGKLDTLHADLSNVSTSLATLHTDLGHLTDGTATVTPVGPTTSTVTQVASSATVVTLQASNTARKGLSIYNDSTSVLYVKRGTGAATNNYSVQIPAQGYYELPAPYYRGVITGIWASANGNAYVTEDS